MNIAAYCRVSTDKEDQLNSLEAQKEFFSEYTKRTGDNLVRLYADATCIIGTNQSPSEWAAICPYFFFSQNFWGRKHSG